jgi:hypothetical protein
VYVIRLIELDLVGLDFVKIGQATNISQRLDTLQTGCPFVMRVERILEAPNGRTEELEDKLHRRYRTKRVRGEWFRLTKQEVIDMPDWDHMSGSNHRAMIAFLDGLGAP